MVTEHRFVCSDCKQEIVHINPDGCGGVGYGTYDNDKKVCYECCAKRDWDNMKATGKAALYLIQSVASVVPNWPTLTNWPGTLRIPVKSRRVGRHNFAGSRTDVWFNGPDGERWHGVQLGDKSQICRCRRLKAG